MERDVFVGVFGGTKHTLSRERLDWRLTNGGRPRENPREEKEMSGLCQHEKAYYRTKA